MTTKEYLSQIRVLDIQIGHRQKQLDELRALATSCGATGQTGERVTSSGSGDRMADLVSSYVDLQNRINALIDRYIDLKDKIITEIHMIGIAASEDLLFKRYVEFKRWEQIAVEMNYSIRGIYKLHGRALQEFEERRSEENELPKNA